MLKLTSNLILFDNHIRHISDTRHRYETSLLINSTGSLSNFKKTLTKAKRRLCVCALFTSVGWYVQ